MQDAFFFAYRCSLLTADKDNTSPAYMLASDVYSLGVTLSPEGRADDVMSRLELLDAAAEPPWGASKRRP